MDIFKVDYEMNICVYIIIGLKVVFNIYIIIYKFLVLCNFVIKIINVIVLFYEIK